MGFVVYAVGSPFVYEIDEILKRAGLTVEAYVANRTDGWRPDRLTPLLTPEALTADHLKSPVVIPLITPAHRKLVFEETSARGFTHFPALRDPTAIVASSAVLDEGVILNAAVVVGANTHLGRFTLLNRSTSIGHDVITEDYVTIGPGSIISGSCRFKRGAFVGAGAIVTPEHTIGANSIVGAGAVVVKDVPDNCIVAGNPARIIREHIAGYNDVSV